MRKNKRIITLYFYVGYLLLCAVLLTQTLLNKSAGSVLPYADTLPWQSLYILIIWTLLAWLYLKKTTITNLPDTIFTMAFTWLLNMIPFDIATRVLIKHPYSMKLGEFFTKQQPFLTVNYAVIFAAPFIACFLWRRFKPQGNKKMSY